MANEPKDEKTKAEPTELTDETLEDAQGGLRLSFGDAQPGLRLPTGGIAQTALLSPELKVDTLKGAGQTPPIDLKFKIDEV